MILLVKRSLFLFIAVVILTVLGWWCFVTNFATFYQGLPPFAETILTVAIGSLLLLALLSVGFRRIRNRAHVVALLLLAVWPFLNTMSFGYTDSQNPLQFRMLPDTSLFSLVDKAPHQWVSGPARASAYFRKHFSHREIRTASPRLPDRQLFNVLGGARRFTRDTSYRMELTTREFNKLRSMATMTVAARQLPGAYYFINSSTNATSVPSTYVYVYAENRIFFIENGESVLKNIK